MSKKKIAAKVLSQTMAADNICDMWIETSLADDAQAGQFIGIYPADSATLLPRPISICRVDKQRKALRVMYRIVGSGTAEFALYQSGDVLQIIGMLGNGFPLDKCAGKKVMIMGGGIGLPPLLELAAEISELPQEERPNKVTIVLGYRNSDTFLNNEFAKYGDVLIASEDGSIGTKGNVLDAVNETKTVADVIYACGPMPMLRAIKKYSAEKSIKAFISLEERMACGVGACLGCVCKTVKKDDHSQVFNARICTEGPVFDAETVDI